MALLKTHTEDPSRASKKVLVKNGITYENEHFKLVGTEKSGLLGKIKTALGKGKYQILAKSQEDPKKFLVIAEAEKAEEIISDWKTVNEKYTPIMTGQSGTHGQSQAQNTQDMGNNGAVKEDCKAIGKNDGAASSNVSKSGSTTSGVNNSANGSANDGPLAGQTEVDELKSNQRKEFEERMANVASKSAANCTKTLLDYNYFRTLGTGSFGRVILVQDKYGHSGNTLNETNRPKSGSISALDNSTISSITSSSESGGNKYYALKIIKKEIIVKLKQIEHTANEKNILSCITCPFLISMDCVFQDKRSLYFVLEYINGGEMFTHIHRNKFFSFEIAKHFTGEVVLALEYLHNLDIVYRDLKPENLLIDSQGHVKITDFGFAKRVPERTWTLCGTPEYLAPEIILSKGYSHAVDWWAVGVLLYEMRSGHAPFYDNNQMEMYKKIVEGRLAFPSHFKPEEKLIMSNFMTSDLTHRLGNMKNKTLDIRNHIYFKNTDWDALYSKSVKSPYIPTVKHDGDDSNFDRYDEEPLHWRNEPELADPYYEIFKAF